MGAAAKHKYIHQLRHVLVSGHNHRKGYHLPDGKSWVGYFRAMALPGTMNELAVYILAGGRSTRMGRDKALLLYEGKTLLERALQTAAFVSRNVFIVGEAKKYSHQGAVVEDVYRDCGPLGAIHAALQSSAADHNLMLAVDMPFVSSTMLQFLAEQAMGSGADVTVPEVETKLQPLCAVYRRAFVPMAENALKNERYKITSLFAQVTTHVVQEKELAAAGFGADLFRNWNSPTDMKTEVSLE